MTLTIKISNLEYNEAAELTKFVSDKIQDLECGRARDSYELRPPEPQVKFEYDEDQHAVSYRESTPFSRYMSGAKKE